MSNASGEIDNASQVKKVLRKANSDQNGTGGMNVDSEPPSAELRQADVMNWACTIGLWE